MLIAPPPDALTVGLEWIGVVVGAAAVARVVTLVVRPLVDGDAGRPRNDRLIEVGFVACAMVAWWWEMHAVGRLSLPSAGGMVVARHDIAVRHAAHLVLAGLLVAAAWVDLRYRVIPDVITMPGALLGLLWTAADPTILMPVPHEVARSFAAPRIEWDQLGAFGGLRTASIPAWLGACPTPGGVAIALAAFVAWWWTCTAPLTDPDDRLASPWRRRLDPRRLVLMAGALGIMLAWWRGGIPWHAQLASLAGIVVAAGLVWLIRLGASWALAQEAMGFGDVTLMAMAGAWIGWQPCVLALFVGVFIGLVHGLGQVVMRRGNELPFGPSLCIGLGVVVLGWNPLWRLTGPVFERPGELAVVGGAVIVLTALTLAVWRRVRGNAAPGA